MNAPTPSAELDDVEELRRRLLAAERELGQKRYLIDKLEEIIARLQHRAWGRSSERHPGQGELTLFEEAELVAFDEAPDEQSELDAEDGAGSGNAEGHKHSDRNTRRTRPPRCRRSPWGWTRFGATATDRCG